MTPPRTSQLTRLPRFRPWLLVTATCLIYCLWIVSVNTDPLALVTLGTRFTEAVPIEQGGTEGYDGQFVYFIARDPATAPQFIANGGDVPAYRFQRILLPLLARIIALGQVALIPWSILLVNLIALGAGTACVEHLLRQHQVSRWYALGYGFSLGVFGGVRLSLTEPLCYALVLGSLLLVRRERWTWGAALLALAALAKETALLFVAGYGLYLFLQRRWVLMVVFGGIAAMPFAVWQMILRWQLGAFGVGSGGAMATGFEIIPFGGLLRILLGAGIRYEANVLPFGNIGIIPTETVWIPGLLLVFILFLLLLTPFVIFPTVWALREVWKAARSGGLSAADCLLLVNAAIMLFVPFSTYREPLGILRFVVGLHIAILMLGAERRSGRVLLNSTVYAYTLVLLLAWDFTAT